MQKTNFRFEVFVHDDASSDGTTEIIKEYAEKYPDIVKPYYETKNLWSKGDGSFRKLVYSPDLLRGKYIALCEGDDYWTDPNKLQKQVDFLESNNDYYMCFHSASIESSVPRDCPIHIELIEDRDYSANELYKKWIVPTASIVFRREVLYYMNGLIGQERILNGDIIIVLSCCARGKVRCFSRSMSVYRMHPGGVTYNKKKVLERIIKYPDHIRFIYDNFSQILDKQTLKRNLALKLIIRGKCSKLFSNNQLSDFYYAFISSPSFTMSCLVLSIKKGIKRFLVHGKFIHFCHVLKFWFK